ncbi:MAG: peptidyl-prolyl cis-trans isomerase [Burkholderiales bacterium]|nr:peptidyl-prolyl cis-trans isomerase [Burkholderiales bacterium]
MKKVLLTTSMGKIVIELDDAKAPVTVANFVQYVADGHYDGTIFHRVIDNFMIQGGGFDAGMKQKPTRAAIDNEAMNGLKNTVYSIAMARTGDPHSATAQFFINVKDNDFLNFTSPNGNGWGYCVFGKVVEGMDVVDTIRDVPTGTKGFHQNVPNDPVTINKAELV